MKERLLLREWVTVFSIVALMGSVLAISEGSRVRTKHSFEQLKKRSAEELISIEVTGAVRRPGVYRVRVGTKLGDVLRRAKVLKKGAVEAFDLETPLAAPQAIVVLTQKEKRKKLKKSPLSSKPGSPAAKNDCGKIKNFDSLFALNRGNL